MWTWFTLPNDELHPPSGHTCILLFVYHLPLVGDAQKVDFDLMTKIVLE